MWLWVFFSLSWERLLNSVFSRFVCLDRRFLPLFPSLSLWAFLWLHRMTAQSPSDWGLNPTHHPVIVKVGRAANYATVPQLQTGGQGQIETPQKTHETWHVWLFSPKNIPRKKKSIKFVALGFFNFIIKALFFIVVFWMCKCVCDDTKCVLNY